MNTTSATNSPELKATRLAAFEIEGWRLISGVLMHELDPENRIFPSEHERRTLPNGFKVKMHYELDEPSVEDPDEFDIGSMNAFVRGRDGPYYIGEVESLGKHSKINKLLKVGDRILFLPEHVCVIFESNYRLPKG